jgi:hypothetical protein
VVDSPVLVDALRHERTEFASAAAFSGTCLTTGLRLTDSPNGLGALSRRVPIAAEPHGPWSKSPAAGCVMWRFQSTIEYTAYSLTKGQRIGDSVTILLDLFAQELYR